VIAAAVIGDVRTVSRFPSHDHFAAYNGTAPIEVSSGGRKIYRLSRRNRAVDQADRNLRSAACDLHQRREAHQVEPRLKARRAHWGRR
jgi:transposase